ncbi:hypothetical protein GYMLUDRAFT_40705 [Collybiopsis luxurians FD-317 M1]|uniref:MYND-type domain-containing protein n=1 Tax=Collybiopsis luxurians FD-317 M1 TaxID=944289 RepID=A0A0D0C690_9AGAR|nr:hypothetical protein GYMLUDRAFT_40705 [Collybiopsis luxurians FD-317 M1]
MDAFASAFSRLPYFSPMMMINRSETCATRRLNQCTDFGVNTNDVTQKFYGDPDDATDLSELDFYARKAIIEEVAEWCDENEGKKPEVIHENKWTPILYRYEIVKSSAKRARDWGDLVFTDATISRYLIVMIFPETCECGNFSHHDYDSITKYQADRLMSLLTYLHHDWKWGNRPNWVRATYTTPERKFKLTPDFLTKIGSMSLKPFICHVTPDDFVPSLSPSELEKIDNVVAQGGSSMKRTETSVRDKVIGSKETKPNVAAPFRRRNPRQCAHCETVSKDKDLQQCGRCKLVFYCGRECQRKAWPTHKIYCRAAET